MEPVQIIGLILLALVVIFIVKTVFKIALRMAVLIGVVLLGVLYYLGYLPFGL